MYRTCFSLDIYRTCQNMKIIILIFSCIFNSLMQLYSVHEQKIKGCPHITNNKIIASYLQLVKMMFLPFCHVWMCRKDPGQSIIFISYDYSYFILLASPATEQWITNKCLIGTVATTAASHVVPVKPFLNSNLGDRRKGPL